MINIRKAIRNERGSQLLEFLAIFPLIIFAFLFIWQMALAAYSIVIAEVSARDGARVAAIMEDFSGGEVEYAVNQAAKSLEVRNVNVKEGSTSYGREVTVEVQVQMRTIDVPFIGELDFPITGDATMPYEVDDDD
ncbi:septum site-determining protein [Geomicrobium sp. JCM 19037]|uniref:TadE/TadG family type IV pilus assembly protein n=1 Tax=Geomicrobium sp. JCM 19037 TaxID=1460634 RepID=UPI00045F2F8B|nr:TadE family protein [Geomicrobium sp. JCM 19037]GAK06095.1 septum site-determining protein [Geomicrobium sp. JCM 19037]